MQVNQRCRSGRGASQPEMQVSQKCMTASSVGHPEVQVRQRCRSGIGAGQAEMQVRNRCRSARFRSDRGAGQPKIGARIAECTGVTPVV